MAKFEVVSKYAAAGIPIPSYETERSAGVDFVVAEDIVIPSYHNMWYSAMKTIGEVKNPMTLAEMNRFTNSRNCKPTLVPTGIKCQLDEGEYLELAMRSSSPLKYWLILANSVGVIDADYYNNESNEGHIFLQVINLSPFDIKLQKGEKIGQGIIHNYISAKDSARGGLRTGGFGSTNG